jgi:hypothetical protein
MAQQRQQQQQKLDIQLLILSESDCWCILCCAAANMPAGRQHQYLAFPNQLQV